MIVAFIVGSTDSRVDGISLVDGKEEDKVPYAPKGNRNDGEDNGVEHISSGSSVISSEEINHETSSKSNWA